MTSEALRVLALAYRKLGSDEDFENRETLESNIAICWACRDD